MASVSIRNVTVRFGSQSVLDNVSLDIREGEFIVLLGPSGCGKSTLLNAVAGLMDVDGGEVWIGDANVTWEEPKDRGIAMVFQSYALYPRMNVRQNMSFGLRMAKTPATEIAERVTRAAGMLQITPLLDRRPDQLSGGQRQRVAIGRAITRNPKVFLFDEPLSNLDAALRVATRIEIARLHETMPGTTMIYVTHDQVEAMTLADRIVVLNAGNIEQVGSPMELYHHPANLFVAGFIGSPAMNIVDAAIVADGGGTRISAAGGAPVAADVDLPANAAGTKVKLGVRPEDLVPTDAGNALFSGTVSIVEKLGEVTLVYLDVGTPAPIVVKLEGDATVQRGETMHVSAPGDRLHIFDGSGSSFRRTGDRQAA